MGNSGVVRIKEVGRNVKTVRPGQTAIIFCNGEEDWWGYPKKILGYDAANTMGCLATKMKLTQRQVIPLPENTAADGARTTFITFNAPGFVGTAAALTVTDNDLHHYTVSAISSPQIAGGPIAVTVQAVTFDGTPIATALPALTLSASAASTAEPRQRSSGMARALCCRGCQPSKTCG